MYKSMSIAEAWRQLEEMGVDTRRLKKMNFPDSTAIELCISVEKLLKRHHKLLPAN